MAGRIAGIYSRNKQFVRSVRKAPNSNIQAPEKHQAANFKQGHAPALVLGFGASLELGCWSLELGKNSKQDIKNSLKKPSPFYHSPTARPPK
jgi:hypothetical protein